MIPFEEIDSRLEALGKDRKWLAEVSGRKPDSIRVALAPNSDPKNRSSLLQKALTDAIEREDERQRQPSILPAPLPMLPDRITIQCAPEDRRRWQKASEGNMDQWIVESLNQAADLKLGIAPGNTGTDGP
jgi:hypothetical protein